MIVLADRKRHARHAVHAEVVKGSCIFIGGHGGVADLPVGA